MIGMIGILGALLALPQEKELRDLTAAEVVEWMAKESGRKFVYGESLGLQNRRVQVGRDALDSRVAYELGLRLLKAVDIAAVPDPATGTVELVATPMAGKKSLAVHTSVEQLPKADEFCSLVIKVRHVSPRDIQAALLNVASFPQNVLSMEASSQLVLSDYASVLRKMAQIAAQADVAGAAASFRIDIAVLEAQAGGEAALPEEFKDLDLPRLAKANRFKVLGEMSARFKVADSLMGIQQRKTPAPTEATLRMRGARPMIVDMGGSLRGGAGPVFERFTVSLDQEGAPLGILVLQTRVEFRAKAWVVVGIVPGEGLGGSLVVLARAEPQD